MMTLRSILALLTLPFFISDLEAQSAVKAEKKRERSSYESQELHRSLTTENPSKESLKAFETRIGQKFRDLTDYMRILSDPSFEEPLRDRARKQALELFDSSSTKISGFPLDGDRSFEGSVARTLDSLRNEGAKFSIEVEEFRSGPFQENENGTYKGSFEFEIRIDLEGPHGEKKELELKGKGISLLKKVSKRFGEEKKRVWETFLGNVEFSD